MAPGNYKHLLSPTYNITPTGETKESQGTRTPKHLLEFLLNSVVNSSGFSYYIIIIIIII